MMVRVTIENVFHCNADVVDVVGLKCNIDCKIDLIVLMVVFI